MYELKPCPFCGGKAVLVRHPFDAKIDTFGVQCAKCGCMTQPNYTFNIGAIGVWNKRTEVNCEKEKK